MHSNETITASVNVKNTGNVAGIETVQLYLRDLTGSVVRPVLELRDFQRISLHPGECKTVTFIITEAMPRFYTRDMTFQSEPGDFEVHIGPNSSELLTVADTKHAVGLTSTDGIELLIHVGLDTVSMNGRGFQVYVKEGDTVRCGQKLLSFSKSAIKSAVFLDTTAVLVVNSSNYQSVEVCKKGSVKRFEKLMIAE